jgi:hypothetical protein
MKSRAFIAGALLALSSGVSHAQFVNGNDAVEQLPGGGRRVEIAPLPSAMRTSRACRADGSCKAGPWHMVETAAGLMECTEAFARPGTCRPSTYGTTRASRLWIVKVKDLWLQCQYPDLRSRCVPMFARPPANLPYDAVQ